MPKALISYTRPTFLAAVRAITDHFELVTPQDLKEHPELLGELEIAYGGLDRDQLSRATSLRWLQTSGAGVNGLLTPELVESDLIVTNASGIHAEPITEHMFGMLLMVTRKLAVAWDQQKTRQWRGYDFHRNVDMLSGKTLGLYGVGAIGTHSARVGKAFGMRVIGLRRTSEPHPDLDRTYGPEERLAFFAECDVMMNSAPLTDRTRHGIGGAEFAVMKPGVIVVNTGRGATIHTPALVDALRSGKVGAALLDVTDPEPLPEDHPLWTMENVYITPHTSGSHPGYQQRAGQIFLENLRRYLAQEPMINVVDKREGY